MVMLEMATAQYYSAVGAKLGFRFRVRYVHAISGLCA